MYTTCMETFKIDHDVRAGAHGPKKPRYKGINVRLNNVEHNRATAIAYEQGKSVSDMVRHYLQICLDAYEKEFGSVSYKGSPETKTTNPKIETLADAFTLTIKADEKRIKDGWSEIQRIKVLRDQSKSFDKVVAQAAIDLFELRRNEKSANKAN